jgi:hypothetical protein
MRKMVLIMDCGPGMHQYEAFLVGDDVTEAQLNTYSWERGIEFASMYGIYPMSDMPEDFDEDEEGCMSNQYSDDIEGYFVPFNEEEHDGWLTLGNEPINWQEF